MADAYTTTGTTAPSAARTLCPVCHEVFTVSSLSFRVEGGSAYEWIRLVAPDGSVIHACGEAA